MVKPVSPSKVIEATVHGEHMLVLRLLIRLCWLWLCFFCVVVVICGRVFGGGGVFVFFSGLE